MKTKTGLYLIIISMHLLPLAVGAQEGREHTLIVCESGAVKSFGYNTSCQLGSGSQSPTSYTTPYSINSSYMDNAVSVAVGDKHSLALMDDGTVKAWGSNVAGCSGLSYPTNTVVCTPNEIDLPGCAVAVAAGSSFSMALLADGTIYAWGRNNYGQLGNGSNTTDTHVPDDVAGITTAVAIAAGSQHAMALLDDGSVMVWGYGSDGQLGDGTTASTNYTAGSITVPGGMSDVVAIDAGGNHCIVLTDDNKVYSWGANLDGQLGVGSSNNYEDEPQYSSGFSGGTEIDVAAGSDFSIVLRSGGSTRVAGSNQRRQLGLSSPTSSPWPSTPITGPTISSAIDIVAPATARHAWAITSSGGVYSWGDNNYGACGFVSAYPEVDTPTGISLGCTAIPSEDNHPQPCCVSVLEDERIELNDVTFTSTQV